MNDNDINKLVALVFMIPFALIFTHHWISYVVTFLYFYLMIWYAIDGWDKLRNRKVE